MLVIESRVAPVFGHQVDAGINRLPRIADLELLASESEVAFQRWFNPKNGLGHFGATCAHQPGKPQNLALGPLRS